LDQAVDAHKYTYRVQLQCKTSSLLGWSALECGGTTPLWVEAPKDMLALNRATCRAEEKRRRAAALQGALRQRKSNVRL